MKKIAILVDGGFLNKKLPNKHQNPEVQAQRLVNAARACMEPDDEDLYRIFYYDCAPTDRKVKDLAGTPVDFGKTPQYAYQRSLLAHIAKLPFVAVRLGMLSYNGWVLKPRVAARLRRNPQGANAFNVTDFKPDFQQKGVDMRIGLDVALLAIDHLVDRVALITADSDFIPAMKLARREGLQVVLSSFSHRSKPELLHHADIYRSPDPTQF